MSLVRAQPPKPKKRIEMNQEQLEEQEEKLIKEYQKKKYQKRKYGN